MSNKDLLKPFSITFHCLIWSIYLAWITWGNVARYGISHVFVVVAVVPFILGLVYLHRYWLRKLIVARRGRKKILFWSCLVIIALGGLVYIFLYKYRLGVSKMLLPSPEEQQFRDYVLDYIDFYLRFASIGVGLGGTEMFVNLLRERGKAFQQKRYDIAAKQKSKRLKRWITHFAGNITNGTVYSMKKQAHPQQVSASVAINGYIVRLLARENMFWVSLEEELYYLQRFREMFSVFPIQFKIPSETYQHQVMPLCLLVLYKNICKHGAFDTDAPAASFCVVTSPDRLLVITQNTIASDAMWVYNEGGTGLEQLRELLLENHGDKMTFEYAMEGNRFWLRLEIIYNTELYHQMKNNYGQKPACVTGDGSR